MQQSRCSSRSKAALMAIAVPQWAAATSADIIVHHAVEASWGSLTKWNVFDRTPRALRKWRVDALGNGADVITHVPAARRRADCRRIEIARHGQKFSQCASAGIRGCDAARKRRNPSAMVRHPLLLRPTTPQRRAMERRWRARCGSAEPSIVTGTRSRRLFAWESGCRPGLPGRETKQMIRKGSARARRCTLDLEAVPRKTFAPLADRAERPAADARRRRSAPSADCQSSPPGTAIRPTHRPPAPE